MPKSFFPENPVFPSRVTNCLFISYDGKTGESENEEESDYTDEDFSDEDNLLRPLVETTERMQKFKKMKEKNILEETYVGKWMLFYNSRRISLARGMTHLDYAWQFAKRLVDDSENTGITSACCSTANPFPYGTDPNDENGVICCFTEDYRNKPEVKKAAEAIRQVLYYPRNMFYKTDDATLSGLFRYFGNKFVSLYKFTTDNKLYQRDQDILYQWNPVIVKS